MKPILLVEDNADDVFFMKRAFKQASIQNPLIVIDDGEKAIQSLKKSLSGDQQTGHLLPGMVLLDLNLPGRSGMEILEWMRLQPELKDLTTVVLTSSELSKDGGEALKHGADDLMVKPPTPEKLTALRDRLGFPPVFVQGERVKG